MSLGDRMKTYEQASRMHLTRRMPMIIRCDGKAFHSYTKSLNKPWDRDMRNAMTEAARALMTSIQGAKVAYVQSDEISVLATDYDSLEFEPWFGKNVQKTVSVSASIATQAFNAAMPHKPTACFDARCFVLPKEEVNNYFIWRQQDAVRNSIQGLGQKHFSHKQLHKKNTNDIQEMLFQKYGINWNDYDIWKKRGWCVVRKQLLLEKSDGSECQLPYTYTRTTIESDWEIPTFSKNKEYINQYVFLELEI